MRRVGPAGGVNWNMTEESDTPKPGDIVLPITNRKMTVEEINQATEWINKKSVRKSDECPVCDSPHNLVQPTMAPMPGGVDPFDGTSGWVYPSIVTVCFNCGFTRHFNAVVMGMAPGAQADAGGNDG